MKTIKNTMGGFVLLAVNLGLFDGAAPYVNRTTDSDLAPEMKTFYHKQLIKMAGPELVHDQFGQKRDITKGGGKTIEFRKYSPLPKLLTPLTEGVTPNGQKLKVSTVEATVAQYGGFVPVSDILSVTAVDNNIAEATELLAQQAGQTLDSVTREVLAGGTNVQFAGGKNARYELSADSNCYLTVDAIRRAVRKLKSMNAKKIDGYYVAIINQDCSFDLMNDAEWKYPHQYVDTENIYKGEIGAIAGCRFVETSEAKKFVAKPLSEGAREFTVKTAGSAAKVAINEALTDADALALVGRKVIVGNILATVASATSGAAGSATVTFTESVTVTTSDKLYPGEAGAEGRDVYATLVIGANAYGVTGIEGLGLEHIFKPLGSGGTSDPLNQRATCGWKASKVAVRLVEEYMVRIESCSTFSDGVEN